jgi:hypothetical protein
MSSWIVTIGMSNILTQTPTIRKDSQSNARNVPTERRVLAMIHREVVLRGEEA